MKRMENIKEQKCARLPSTVSVPEVYKAHRVQADQTSTEDKQPCFTSSTACKGMPWSAGFAVVV
jgi:hypothetical protein